MARDYDEVRRYGIYGCLVDDEIVYVGSSCCKLENLEHNHRNWEEKYGPEGRTHFRENLLNLPHARFVWLCDPVRMTRAEIEQVEREFIGHYNPRFNIDMDPYATSVWRGRITPSRHT